MSQIQHLAQELNRIDTPQAIEAAFELALQSEYEWIQPQIDCLTRLTLAAFWQQLQLWRADGDALKIGLSYARILTLTRLQLPFLRFPLTQEEDWTHCHSACHLHTTYADEWTDMLHTRLPLRLSAAGLLDLALRLYQHMADSALRYNGYENKMGGDMFAWAQAAMPPKNAVVPSLQSLLDKISSGYSAPELALLAQYADALERYLRNIRTYPRVDAVFLRILPLQQADWQRHLHSHNFVGWSAAGDNLRSTDEQDRVYRCYFNTKIPHNLWLRDSEKLPLLLGLEGTRCDYKTVSLQGAMSPNIIGGSHSGDSLQFFAFLRPDSGRLFEDW